jgi:ribonuclease J
MFQIRPIGGYGEVGKNCTAVRVDDEVVLLDLGLKMDNYVAMTEDEDYVHISGKQLIAAGAAPDVNMLQDWKPMVKGIILGHAHLDHIGAVPYLANRFKCPIYGSPFTIAVLRSILADQDIELKNECKTIMPNASFQLTPSIKVQFVNMTHSSPQTVSIVLHTKYGKLMYANDFKLDMNPIIGEPVDYKALESIHPDYLIMDSLYGLKETRTPSESVAREMLLDLFSSTDFTGKAIFVTTFSSHIARLKTIVECAKKINRKVIFLGRSLQKYINAAKEVGIGGDFIDMQMVKYGSKVRGFMSTIKKPYEYVFVVTGHQGEPKAVLSRLLEFYNFKPEDVVVFSCTTIPTPLTIKNREQLEKSLKSRKIRIYKDIHVSGHGAKEDIREFIKLLRPKKIIPSHAPIETTKEVKRFVQELGYISKDILLVNNGETIHLG